MPRLLGGLPFRIDGIHQTWFYSATYTGKSLSYSLTNRDLMQCHSRALGWNSRVLRLNFRITKDGRLRRAGMFRRPPPKLARFIRLFIYTMAMPVTAVLRVTDTVGKLVRRTRRDGAQEAESIEGTALAD